MFFIGAGYVAGSFVCALDGWAIETCGETISGFGRKIIGEIPCRGWLAGGVEDRLEFFLHTKQQKISIGQEHCYMSIHCSGFFSREMHKTLNRKHSRQKLGSCATYTDHQTSRKISSHTEGIYRIVYKPPLSRSAYQLKS